MTATELLAQYPQRAAVAINGAAYTVEEIRQILDARDRCWSDCKGWDVFDNGDDDRGIHIERCDECAALNGYATILYDDDFERLPEALAAVTALHPTVRP